MCTPLRLSLRLCNPTNHVSVIAPPTAIHAAELGAAQRTGGIAVEGSAQGVAFKVVATVGNDRILHHLECDRAIDPIEIIVKLQIIIIVALLLSSTTAHTPPTILAVVLAVVLPLPTALPPRRMGKLTGRPVALKPEIALLHLLPRIPPLRMRERARRSVALEAEVALLLISGRVAGGGALARAPALRVDKATLCVLTLHRKPALFPTGAGCAFIAHGGAPFVAGSIAGGASRDLLHMAESDAVPKLV